MLFKVELHGRTESPGEEREGKHTNSAINFADPLSDSL